MKKALLIAEKPSLERAISEVYRKHKSEFDVDITFCHQAGHLIALKNPKEIDPSMGHWSWDQLPFYPDEHGGWQYKIIDSSRDLYKEVSAQLKSGKYDFVIHAGDPDREGELLVRLVLAYAKNKLPVKRFWQNDLTEGNVLHALHNLRDDDHDPMLTNLLSSAYGRQRADYIFGMNITQAATLKMGAFAPQGRVRTPILSIICKREEEIENFVPKTTYGVKALYTEGFEGTLYDLKKSNEILQAAMAGQGTADASKLENPGVIWFETKEDAQKLIDAFEKEGTVVNISKKQTSTYAPKLYKLSSAQVACGKIGLGASASLETIQALYEKKILSYPRTDCEYLSSETDFRGILDALHDVPEFAPYVDSITDRDIARVRGTKKWINNKELEAAGHSALIPTTISMDDASLSGTEMQVYKMIAKSFIAMFLPPLVQDKVELVTAIPTKNGDQKLFRSQGKTLVDPGYTRIFGTSFTDVNIPEHKKGDVLSVSKYDLAQKTTTCPKRYTSPELVAVLNSPAKFLLDDSYKALGKQLHIGTPATQAPIIDSLIHRDKYVEVVKEGKTERLKPTMTGRTVIRNLKGSDITRVDLTGEWETELDDVKSGKMSLSEFEKITKTHVEKLLRDIKNSEVTMLPNAKRKTYETIGTCPRCGKDLCESEKGFFCMGYKDKPKCGVGAFKEFYGHTLTKEEFLQLLSGKELDVELSYQNRSYRQKIRYDKDASRVMVSNGEEKAIGTCPMCGKDILEGDSRYRCQGGDFSMGKRFGGAPITKDDVMTLLSGGTITKELHKRDGSGTWEQPLSYDKKEKKMIFVNPNATKSGLKCPCCKKELDEIKRETNGETSRYFKCSCGFHMNEKIAGRTMEFEEIEEILKGKECGPFEGFYSPKKDKYFAAKLKVDKRKKEVTFAFDAPATKKKTKKS